MNVACSSPQEHSIIQNHDKQSDLTLRPKKRETIDDCSNVLNDCTLYFAGSAPAISISCRGEHIIPVPVCTK